MKPRFIENPGGKAEGHCDETPYDTNLVNSDGVNIHFWCQDFPLTDRIDRLLSRARRSRDIVSCTFSCGDPEGFWAHQNI